MKTLLNLMIILQAALGLHAQGTVEFKNFVAGGAKVRICYRWGSTFPGWCSNPTRYDCPVEGFLVGLYWAPAGTFDPAAFQQLGPATSLSRPGYFNAGPRTIPEPFVGGANASFIVKVWSSQYASYEEMIASGNLYVSLGSSPIWTQKTGNPNASPPDTPPSIGSFGFPGLTIVAYVPEPNTITLGLLSLAGWFLARRMRRYQEKYECLQARSFQANAVQSHRDGPEQIPKGFHNKAQSCESASYPGFPGKKNPQP